MTRGHWLAALVAAACAASGPRVDDDAGLPASANAPTPPEAEPATAVRPAVTALLWSLDDARSAAEIRDRLTAGCEPGELHRPCFDGQTLSRCIDHVAAAVLAARAGHRAMPGQRRLDDVAEPYLAARREALVRCSIGSASCLPPIR